MKQILKTIGNKNLFDLYNDYIEITDLNIKIHNAVVSNINDLIKFLEENNLKVLDDDNNMFMKLNKDYPIVLCGYGFYENKKVYYYCDLIRSRNTYKNDGLYTINLIIHNL